MVGSVADVYAIVVPELAGADSPAAEAHGQATLPAEGVVVIAPTSSYSGDHQAELG